MCSSQTVGSRTGLLLRVEASTPTLFRNTLRIGRSKLQVQRLLLTFVKREPFAFKLKRKNEIRISHVSAIWDRLESEGPVSAGSDAAYFGLPVKVSSPLLGAGRTLSEGRVGDQQDSRIGRGRAVFSCRNNLYRSSAPA